MHPLRAPVRLSQGDAVDAQRAHRRSPRLRGRRLRAGGQEIARRVRQDPRGRNLGSRPMITTAQRARESRRRPMPIATIDLLPIQQIARVEIETRVVPPEPRLDPWPQTENTSSELIAWHRRRAERWRARVMRRALLGMWRRLRRLLHLSSGGRGIGGLRPPFFKSRTPMRSIGYVAKRSG